jgi:hypothetical protein
MVNSSIHYDRLSSLLSVGPIGPHSKYLLAQNVLLYNIFK